MKEIRTRYAPSPTGYLHIGGARTATFAYLFAKANNGKFIVRIEDTDLERNVIDGEKSQLENLKWLGIIPDESPINPNPKFSPYRQSEKLSRYNELIDVLVKKGIAYESFDTLDELDMQKEEQIKKGLYSFRYDKNWLSISNEEKDIRRKNKQVSIRLSLPKDVTYSWNDQVRGNINYDSKEISEFVIRKANGIPTYIFANTIDDYEQKITHVHRGEEHISNTPKQLAIYNAFNWAPPIFGHFTIITNIDGKKLSKRDIKLKQFIHQYRDEGYLPEAIFNFLILLGWSHPKSKEIFSYNEIITNFDATRFSKSPTTFDIKKMQWISNQYIKALDDDKYIQIAKKFLNQDKINTKDPNWLRMLLIIFKPQIYAFGQLVNLTNTYFDVEIKNHSFSEKILNYNNNVVNLFYEEFLSMEFTIENISLAITNVGKKLNIRGKELFLPIRLVTTYQEHGPELAKAIYLFGKEIIKERIEGWFKCQK